MKRQYSTDEEYEFYLLIRDHIDVIFDVGARNESIYIDFPGEVHYFDPVPDFINQLQTLPTKNRKSYFNKFGLSFENNIKYYYPSFESFFDRIRSCNRSDEANKRELVVRKAKDYIEEAKIERVDFLKIDTEGYEFYVLKGFEEYLSKIKIIQFEYGGTFIDNDTKLVDVVNYLKERGFENFCYLRKDGIIPIADFSDHYEYSNIVCTHKSLPVKLF